MKNVFSENIVFAIGTILGLFGIFAGHRLLIYRERKKRFDDAAIELRSVFNKVFVDIENGICGFGNRMSDSMINDHKIAYLNFRHHLKGEYLKQYDTAWDQYCFDCKNIGGFGLLRTKTRITRVDIKHDIKNLLSFTDYSLLKNISFYIQNIWFHIRLKTGTNKETNQLIKGLVDKINNKNNLLP